MDKPFILSHVQKKYIVLNNLKYNKLRTLKDTSTSTFVKVFLSDPETILKFTFYIYHKINCQLKEIEKNICNPSTEKIIFFFKGGNVMHLFKKKFEDIVSSNKRNQNLSNFEKNLSISDTDFTIYIITNSEKRYNEIYFHVKNKLIEILHQISQIFEKLLTNKGKNNKKNNKNYSLNIMNYRNRQSCDMFEDPTEENAYVQENFKNFYTQDKINTYLKLFSEELTKIATKNNKPNVFYEEKYDGVYTYQIPSKPSPILSPRQNLFISSTNNLPDPINLQNFGDEKNHYVSINSSIFNDLAEASHLIIFDLFRIKFSVSLPDVEKSGPYENYNKNNRNKNIDSLFVPSEFIDISVPRYNDFFLNQFRRSFQTYQNIYLVKNFVLLGCMKLNIFPSILTMTPYYLLKDLIATVFQQNQNLPFIDQKYSKRIFRIFYFLIGSYVFNEIKEIPPPDIMRNVDENFYDYFLEELPPIEVLPYMKGKKISHFFKIKPNFEVIAPLINFTILFNLLIPNKDLLQDYINYYNEIFNIIGNYSADDFIIDFSQFKKELSQNYLQVYKYFFPQIQTMPGGFLTQTQTMPNKFLTQTQTMPNKFLTQKTPNNKSKNTKNSLKNKFLSINDDLSLDIKDVTFELKIAPQYYPTLQIDYD